VKINPPWGQWYPKFGWMGKHERRHDGTIGVIEDDVEKIAKDAWQEIKENGPWSLWSGSAAQTTYEKHGKRKFGGGCPFGF